jgi:serine/threonine-protein kinase
VEELPDLFRDVVGLPAAERVRYFDARNTPQELRDQIESLLPFDTPRGLLTASVEDAVAQLLDDSARAEGTRCGAYTLVRVLGRGGMGTVFLAQRTDGELDQRVAIKFVPATSLSASFRERFLRERQILASLQHPGIAHLVDAGHTAAGHPYLVMEFVDGTPIDRYADARTVRERLELFLRVCGAVAYAHRRLVIHRDIKPSNILVDAAGEPKLLDFGIARMLDDAADPSATKERLLTPEYASPEQVRGAARTTATDIYSLGAVLYRLLTGTSPHTSRINGEGRTDTSGSSEPVPPRRLNPAIPRDLDFVVLKALRREPDGRYASVDAFADDVRAFLSARPVQARSGNAWYWTRKFVRRQWLPAAAVAAVIGSLSIGIYVANRQRGIAERRFFQLRQLSTRLTAVDEAVRNLPGSANARQQMVAASMEYLDGLSREAHQDRELMMELARGYVALAQVQGIPVRPSLGDYDTARESLRKAERFLEPVLAADRVRPDALATASELEEDLMILADTERRGGEVLVHARRSGEYLEALFTGGQATAAQLNIALSYYGNIALAYKNQGRLDESIQFIRRGIERARERRQTPELASFLSILADALRLSGDPDGALPPIVEARQIAEAYSYANELTKALTLYGILIRHGQILGDANGISLNRPAEAIEPFQKALDSMDQVADHEPNDATSRDRVGTTAVQLAALVRRDDPRRALAIYDRGIQRQREEKATAKTRREEARLLAESSYPLRSLGRSTEARQRIETAFERLRATGDYPASTIPSGREAAAVLRARAELQADTGDIAAALATYRGLFDKVMASRPDVERDLRDAGNVANMELAFARLLIRAGRTEEATALENRRRDLWRAWDRKLPGNPFVRHQLETVP